MSKVSDLRDLPGLPEELINAAKDGQFVLFVGAGISRLLGLPSWEKLADNALYQLIEHKDINYAELEELKRLDDPRQKLSIARIIASQNEHELDLCKYFKGVKEGDSIYKSINDIGCACVTTNYDELLEPRFAEVKDGSETYVPVKRICDREEFYIKHLNNPGTVIHMHGAVSQPKSMVLTTDDYLNHYNHPKVSYFLEKLFGNKKILFLGYGLKEAEILEHILRKGRSKTSKTAERRLFALQGHFRNQNGLYKHYHEYYKETFDVHLIGFVRDYEDYHQQNRIIKTWAEELEVKKQPLADEVELMNKVLGND